MTLRVLDDKEIANAVQFSGKLKGTGAADALLTESGESIQRALQERPTGDDLAASDAANNIGTTDGPLQEVIDGKADTEALASDTGWTMTKGKRPGISGPAIRTQEQKNADRFDLRDKLGFDHTGTHDMASLVQQAVNEAISNKTPLYVPVGAPTLGSPIYINDSVSIIGENAGTGKAIAGYNGEQATAASRFHLAHNGKGFALDGDGEVFDMVLFQNIMTSRIQPTPGSGAYTPNNQDFDFDVYNAAGLHLQNVCLLNAARGINMRGGAGIGRLWCENVMGQPLRTGIKIELAADVVRLSNIHFWPFWRDHKEVHRWALENCDHLHFERCDTPLLTNIFSIGARSGIRFGRNDLGATTKFKATNVDIDYCKYGVWFDEDCGNAWAFFNNLTIQGAAATDLANTPGIPVRENIRMEGITTNRLFINGLELGGSSGSAVELATGQQRVEVSGSFLLQDYGLASGNTSPGVSVADGCTFSTANQILSANPGAGPLAGGLGRIKGIPRRWVPGVETQTGAIAGIVIDTARYVEQANKVSGTVTLVITDAGTAGGYLRIGAPLGIGHTFSCNVIDSAMGQDLGCVSITGSPGYFQIQRVGGTPVAVTGRAITVTFEYMVGDAIDPGGGSGEGGGSFDDGEWSEGSEFSDDGGWG